MHKIAFIASWSMVVLFAAIIVFHILVLLGYLPTSIVWGGRHTIKRDIINLELVSISVNTILLLLSMSNLRIWLKPLPYILNKVLLAIFALLFLLNTFGNLYAKTNLERIIFTPITAYLAICFSTLFFTKNNTQKQ